MKRFRELLSKIIEQWISGTVLGILFIVGSSSWSWINDLLFAPSYDYVYTFEKQPNPLKSAQEKMQSSMREMFAEMKKANLHSYNEKETTALLTVMPKFLESLSGEINADQMHVWILNLSRRPLEHVNITFQNCTGYIRLETNPLAPGPKDAGASSTEVLSNGIVYHYGAVKPQSRTFVKAGFNDIRDCSIAIDARRNDNEFATVKYVTSAEYSAYSASLRPDRTNFVSSLVVGIGCSVGTLLILFSLVYRSINQRLSKLERSSSNSRRQLRTQ